MKPIYLSALIITAAILLTACGGPRRIEAPTVTPPAGTISPGGAGGASSMTRYMDDLNYMLYVLENNFGLFDVAQRVHGVCIYEIFDNVHEALWANPDMDVDEFFATLVRYFAPMHGRIGDFAIIGPTRYNQILNRYSMDRRNFSHEAIQRLLEPHVAYFYEQRYPVPFIPTDWTAILYDLHAQDSLEQAIDGWYGWLLFRLRKHGGEHIADDFYNAIVRANAAEAERLFSYALSFLADAPRVSGRVLEEGRVAYLLVESFWNRYDHFIWNFYEEIRDFDHLIIDVRFAGGDLYWFISRLLEPHLDRPHAIDSFSFLVRGNYASAYTNLNFTSSWARLSQIMPVDRQIRPIDEILQAHDLPDLDHRDMARMNYGFRNQTALNPRGIAPRFCTEPTFPGKIWLLTGRGLHETTQLTAWLARETGFATVVGETTAGNWGGSRTFVTLPYSGIAFQMGLFYVTDSSGRTFEAGIEPDIFTMDGKCALETVLYIIETGGYWR